MKAVGDDATIRWYGPWVPKVGDVLRTPTGWQYLVTECGGRTGRALKCIVMPSFPPFVPSVPPRTTFEADWKTYGNVAGPMRNDAMLVAGADLVLAFPFGDDTTSPGTWDCIRNAARRGIPTSVCAKGRP